MLVISYFIARWPIRIANRFAHQIYHIFIHVSSCIYQLWGVNFACQIKKRQVQFMMQDKNSFKTFLPFIVIFFAINLLLLVLKSPLQKWNVDWNVLMVGNLILFFATFFSFLIFRRGLGDSNPHVFMRMTYGGMIVRMGICLIAALLYAWGYGGKVNKFAVLGCFVFYFVYTFAEVKILLSQSKQQKNA
jgi:hypothetical protein